MHRDLASLLDRIRLLLEQAPADPAVPILTELENTLTDGYAVALELEGERLRLVRQIGDLAHSVKGPKQADELRAGAERLHEIDREFAGLREVLQELQRRVGSARAVA